MDLVRDIIIRTRIAVEAGEEVQLTLSEIVQCTDDSARRDGFVVFHGCVSEVFAVV